MAPENGTAAEESPGEENHPNVENPRVQRKDCDVCTDESSDALALPKCAASDQEAVRDRRRVRRPDAGVDSRLESIDACKHLEF
jgi:hypothetical protein